MKIGTKLITIAIVFGLQWASFLVHAQEGVKFEHKKNRFTWKKKSKSHGSRTRIKVTRYKVDWLHMPGTPHSSYIHWIKLSTVSEPKPEDLPPCTSAPISILGPGLYDPETLETLAVEKVQNQIRVLWTRPQHNQCLIVSDLLDLDQPESDDTRFRQAWFERFGTILYNSEYMRHNFYLIRSTALELPVTKLFDQVRPLFDQGQEWNWSDQPEAIQSKYFRNLVHVLYAYYRPSLFQDHRYPSGISWIKANVADAYRYDFTLQPGTPASFPDLNALIHRMSPFK